MSFFSSPRFLPRVLAVDGVTCVGAGLVQLAGGDALASLLQMPPPLLQETGFFLTAFGAALLWMATRATPPRKAIGAIVLGNLAWAIGCIALLAGPWVTPGALGMGWIGIQAASSLLMADLQWMGLRGSRARVGVALAS